ncbi:MAG TPA: hypothetical protein VE944_20065 [Nostoc sp.]|uniref:hypothetical protein n=1 Tax=Nostoc sp. TaxID=1180 RepID=UPI002D6F5D5F|nr:hypothetical protein [Nostoc sp.]HYX16618.1 hypothetical protein [Nostoc sp.]
MPFKNLSSKDLLVNQVFVTAFLVAGIVATSAIAFKYPGDIQFRLGTDGIQLQINVQKDSNRLE